MESGRSNMLLIAILVFIIYGGCNVECRLSLNMTLQNRENITEEIKNKIDTLLEEKLKVYLDLFFNEDLEFDNTKKLKFEHEKLKTDSIDLLRRSKRIRRNVNTSSNVGSLGTTDGGYSEWSKFGPCSKSCGGGIQQRSRNCTKPTPQNGGKSCRVLGPQTETKLCNIVPCLAERYKLNKFRPLSNMQIEGSIDVKSFSIGNDHYMAALFYTCIRLFKWNETIEYFVPHGNKVEVYKAKAFDVFNNMLGTFLVLSEEYKIPYINAPVSRVLTFNEASGQFEHKYNFFVPSSGATKVASYNVFGEMQVAFMFHQSHATNGHNFETTVCGRNIKTIKCGPAGRIKIESAFYGRKVWYTCSYGWYFNMRPCSAEGVLQTIASLCNDKIECVIKSPPDGIRDPCPVFTKYLTVVHNCEAKIYKTSLQVYSVKRNHFEALTSEHLETHGARDIVAFTIHHKTFVAVANYKNDAQTLHLDSEIFIYESAKRRFESFQKVRTDGALDWEFFSIGEGLSTEYFLAVANNAKYDQDGRLNYEIDSVIYKWNWNLFVPFQCIRTNAAIKWTAISGDDGRFLLTLSSGNSNVTIFLYDGWRFYRHDLLPSNPAFLEHGSFTYSVNIDHKALFAIASKSKSPAGVKNFFEAEFEREDSRFLMINKSLSAINNINASLTNLSNVLGFLSKKIVLLNGTNEITGHKTFEKVTVIGDVRVNKVEIGNAKLSQEDNTLIERQEIFEGKLNRSGTELTNLLQRSEKLLSKTKNQTVYAICDFKGKAKVGRFVAKNVVVADKKVNGIDLSHVAMNALYIDQNHTIMGNKTFSSNVWVKNNLTVKEQINDIRTSDLILLESDQMIYGQKAFQGNLFLDGTRDQAKNFEIRGLVNSVNISKDKLLTVRDDQIVKGDYSFVETLNIEKHLTTRLINGIDLSKIYKETILLDTVQNITGLKQFNCDVKVVGNLNFADGITIDGVDVSELSKNILSRKKHQTISNSIELTSNTTVQSFLAVDGVISGINISNDVIYLSREQSISGEKTFLQDITVTKNMEIGGYVNDLKIADDLMTKNADQVITGKKIFRNDVTVKGNIDMMQSKEIDGIDLSELQSQAVFKDKPQIVSGEKHFNDIVIQDLVLSNNTSCYLEQLLKNLTENTLKVNEAASIKGTKVIGNDLLLSEKLIVEGFLNGIKIPSELVFKSNPLVIHGQKTFTKQVKINGKVELDSTMNNLNVSEMYKKALRLVGDQNVTGKLIFMDTVDFKSNLRVNGLVNGLKVPDDLVKLEGDEIISAHKMFNGKVEIDKLSIEEMIADGLVDGVDIGELNRTILRTNGEQIISGNVIFREGLKINGDLQTSGEINGVNLTELDAIAMRLNGDQIITGKKVFSAPIAVTNSLEVSGRVDGVNITELSQNAVRLSGNQTLTGRISFISSLKMKGNLEVSGLVNKINVSKLADEALYKTGNQTVIGKFRFGDVRIFGNVELDGKLNGIDLSEDVVRLSEDEEMIEKLFKDDIRVKGNLFVSGLVDSVNLTDLNEDCVRLDGLQIIDSKKTFIDDFSIMGNMTVYRLLDGIDVGKLRNSILDRNKNQIINGTLKFETDVTFQKQSTIEGYLNDVNISEFKKNVVTLSTDQTIEGEKIFATVTVKDDLILDNLKVIGKVNKKDLSDLCKKIVRVSGRHRIYGSKRFADNVTFNKNVSVSGKINRLRIPQDVCLLSRNQSITGLKIFQDNMFIRGDLIVNNGTKVDGVDVDLLAKNAVYLNKTQTILSPIEIKSTLKLHDGMIVDGLVNGVNITKDNLLLRNGQQIVTGKKTFKHVLVHGHLKLDGKINGVDLLEMNRSSMFLDRDNFIRAEKEIIGNFLIKGNISIAGNINGIKDFEGKFISAKSYINGKIRQSANTITKQEEAVALFTDAVRNLKPRLDYFIEYQTIKVDENVISFDVCESDGNNAILITAEHRSSRSSIYKAEQPSLRFNNFGELPFSNASDVKVFKSGGQIYAALSILQAIPSSKDLSEIFQLGTKEYINFTKTASQATQRAVNTDVSHYLNNTIVTFTNTQNQSDSTFDCVATTPLLLQSNGQVTRLPTISGCNVVKIRTKQVNDYEVLVVSINIGMYGGTDVVVYKFKFNGTYTVLQTIPTNYASDIQFLEVGSTLFLVVANQYQMSQYSIAIEYSVPAQIYHYWKEGNEFLWYQDLDTKGAHLISSFTIDDYVYLIISSRLEELKIFQFFGSGKFRQVSFIRSKGMTNIKALRTWRVDDDIFIGLLSSGLHEINVLKAVKTSLLSGAQIKKALDEV